MVKVAEVFMDYERNVRQAWKYRVEPKKNFNETKDAPGFYEDIMLRGVQVAPEITELTEDQINRIEAKHGIRPKYRIVRGHRRFKALQMIREAHPELKQFVEHALRRLQGAHRAGRDQADVRPRRHGAAERVRAAQFGQASVRHGPFARGDRGSSSARSGHGSRTGSISSSSLRASSENYALRYTPKEDGSNPVKGEGLRLLHAR